MNLTKIKQEAGIEEIRSALNELINGNSPLYEREIEFLSKTQINLLKAVIKKTKHLMSVKANKDFRLGTSNNVKKNIRRLKRHIRKCCGNSDEELCNNCVVLQDRINQLESGDPNKALLMSDTPTKRIK